MHFLVDDTPWAFHHRMYNDKIARVFVPLDLADRAPDPQLPHVTRVTIPLIGERGCSFDPKYDRMIDAIVNGLESPPSAPFFRRLFGGEPPNRTILAWRSTREGIVELYFYSAREIPKHVLVALERCAPGQDFNVASRPDPGWEEYRDHLHPGAALAPLLGSWAQLAKREEHDDQLSVARPVDHTLFFESEAGVNGFLKEIENGEEWVVRRFEAGQPERPLGIDVTQAHALGRVTTDLYVHFLSSRAAAHSGVYDGWGAFEGFAPRADAPHDPGVRLPPARGA
jgi:hypothetical protein